VGVLVGWTAAIHGAGHGDVAGDAGADGVALVIHRALRVFSAGRRRAGGPGVLKLAVVAGRPHRPPVRLPGYRDKVLRRGRRRHKEDEEGDGGPQGGGQAAGVSAHGWHYGGRREEKHATSDLSTSWNTSASVSAARLGRVVGRCVRGRRPGSWQHGLGGGGVGGIHL
jgi:hypothetical protein